MNHVENTPYDYWQLTRPKPALLAPAGRRARAPPDAMGAGAVRSNIMHGSDSVESAAHEIGMWFTPAELIGWTSHSYNMIYE